MPVRAQPLRKRQAGTAIPTGPGISGSTVASSAPTGVSLQTDGHTDAGSPPVITPSTTPSAIVTPTPSATTTVPPKSSPSGISTSTAIAACVGTVVGIILIVLIALYFYRRYTRRLKSEALAAYEKRARAKGNNDRLKGKSLENWNKMDEVGGAGNVQAKQAQIPTGMEQITMFQKSPTIRSPTSGQVMEQNNVSPFDNPFVPYPTPTKAISQSPSPHTDADSAPSISWDGETIGTDTFLSLRSDLAKSSGNVLSKAIPTPPAIEHEHHRWESAEVLHFGGTPDLEEKGQVQDRKDSVSVKSNKTNNNPFAIEVERRKSVSNPFFNARDSSNSSNSNLNTSIPPLPSAKALGKRREVDPFTDDMTIPVRPAAFTRHTPSDSNASYNSDRDRAIQSLVNVLEVSEEDVQERLRIASMQPSFISASSYQGEETDTALPLPPL